MESLPYELQDRIINEIYKRNLPKIDVKTFDKYYMTNANIILKKLEQICNYKSLNKKSLENQEKKLKDIYLSWLLMYYGSESITTPKSILGPNKANLFSEVMRELNKYWTNKNVQDNLCYIYQSMEFKDNNNKLTSNGKICLKYMLNFIIEYRIDFDDVKNIINYLYIETKKNIIKMYNNRQITIKKVNEINKKFHLLFTKWNNMTLISDDEERRDALNNFLKSLSMYWTNDNIKHYYCTIIKSIQWKDASVNMPKYPSFNTGALESEFELMLSILGLYNNKNLKKKEVFNTILLKTVSENRKKICKFLYEEISNVAFSN